MNRAILLLSLLAGACAPHSDKTTDTGGSSTGDDTSTPRDDTANDTGGGTENAQSTAVVTTVSDDYSSGALATVALDGWDVTDSITTVSTDPVVVSDGGKIFEINRYGFDTIRIYEPGRWDTPELEFSVGDGSANPHDVALCDDKLFVSLYGEDHLAIYDPATGTLTGTVDLSAYDDGDGTPEADSMVVKDGYLYVALNRLDRNTWTSSGGTILRVDCVHENISNDYTVGPNASIVDWPGSDLLVVNTGNFGLTDGAIQTLDPSSGALGDPIVSESDLNLTLTGLVVTVSGHALILGADPTDYATYSILCANLDGDGSVTVAETTASYINSVALNDRGEAWIAARPGFGNADSTGGIIVYDVDSCTSLTGSTWIQTNLSPYDIAFY